MQGHSACLVLSDAFQVVQPEDMDTIHMYSDLDPSS